MMTATASFRTKSEYVERIRVLAKSMNKSASYIYNRLVAEHLEDLEDACEADKALAEFAASGEKAIPAEEVWAALGV